MRTLLILALLSASVSVVFAQDPDDIFHKTVDVDEVNRISFDVYPSDRIEYRTWTASRGRIHQEKGQRPRRSAGSLPGIPQRQYRR